MMIGEGRGTWIRGDAGAILDAALASVEPGRLVRAAVSRAGDVVRAGSEAFDLAAYQNIYLIAFGKAAAGSAAAFEEILGGRLTEGLVVVPDSSGESGQRANIQTIAAGHPLPNARSVEAALRALALAEKAGEADLVIACVSGGGSSLLCLPAAGVTLEEKQDLTRLMLHAGADIRELNAVRKHLSGIKGGGLAKAVFPATLINFYISDVVGDDLETIASGPTHWDSSTFGEAHEILVRRGLWKRAPASVRAAIERGLEGDEEETLKRDDPLFATTHDVLLGNNLTALRGARREAERLGYETFILSASDEGEARAAARDHVAFVSTLLCSLGAAPKPVCLLAGGELTVSVKGKGLGGRNTEYVMAALVEIRKSGVEEAFCGACHVPGEGPPSADGRAVDWTMASLGTDGIDGPTDAAGAWIDARAFAEVHRLGLAADEALHDNDSYGFFKKLGNLIVTGPTGTNVMDVRLTLISPLPRL